jgi:osmotically-inducible protein OsmY
MSRMVPSPPDRDVTPNDHLATRVQNFLLSKVSPARGGLNVIADGGVVTLRGSVGSFYHKQLCIHGAQRVAGVHRVVDELVVPHLQAN